MSERQEFSFEYLRARERQIAYILSASAASIAFSRTLADREMHKLSSIFFLVAVAAWSLSFVFGILARNSSIKLLAKSVVVGDMLPMISGTQEEIALAFKTAEEYITESDFVINRYRNLQLLLLLFGAFGFMISIITSSPSFGWLLGDLTL